METLIVMAVSSLLLVITTIIIVRGFLKNQREAMHSFLMKEAEFRKIEGERRKIELTKANKEITLPLRLHAYERITLFCTRLDIVNMLMRTDFQGLSAQQLKQQLTIALEEEFSHNVTQQMYMSEELWSIILIAKKEAMTILRNVFKQLEAAADGKTVPAQKYVDVLIAYLSETPQEGHHHAQAAIKKEISLLF
jgi:hypothetical protein